MSSLKEFQDRLKEHEKAGWSLEYVDFGSTGQMIAVRCKKCGQVIRQLGYDDIEKMHRFTTFSIYIEMTIECTDGSKHVTNCCTDCVNTFTDEDLNTLLDIDVNQLMIEDKVAGYETNDSFLNMMLNRRAVGYAR